MFKFLKRLESSPAGPPADRSLIVRAIEQAYAEPGKGARVRGPRATGHAHNREAWNWLNAVSRGATLITDGSCLGNPGPGGWACILRFGAAAKELFGYDPHTTNNRMELMARVQGLLALKEPCEVEVTTDAEYVRQGMTVWIVHWKRRHWWRKNRPVRNADLWMELDELAGFHRTIWLWTRMPPAQRAATQPGSRLHPAEAAGRAIRRHREPGGRG